jgi:16S rRNA processing protein RimM
MSVNLAEIGEVLKPRGLKGEIKCRICGSLPHEVFIGEKLFKILKASAQNGFTYNISLEGINSIEEAENLRGELIKTDREALKLGEDEVLVSDLTDFEVVDTDGNFLGRLLFVYNFGASDIFDCGSFSFPNEDVFVVETNMIDKKIVIRSEML